MWMLHACDNLLTKKKKKNQAIVQKPLAEKQIVDISQVIM